MSETTMEIVQPEAAVKPYKFRMLEASDVFLMSKIIGAIGVNEFAACFDKEGIKDMIAKMAKNSGKDSVNIAGAAVFLEIANVIFKNLPKCEADIYQMLANVSGMTATQVKKLDFITFTEMVIDFIRKEEFRDFIKVVSRLFK